MNPKKRFKKFSTAYQRWHKQLLALHEGKLWQVKKLARQAKKELNSKTNFRQLNYLSLN